MNSIIDFIFAWGKPARRPITFVDPSKSPARLLPEVQPVIIDDTIQEMEDLNVARESAAVQMQRVYRGFKDRNIVSSLKREREKDERRKLKEENEKAEMERQLMHIEDLYMRSYMKQMEKRRKEEEKLNSQFAYRVVKTNVFIDGKRVSATINVTDKPSLHIAFIIVVHEQSNKKLLLTLSEGEKLDEFIDHYCNNDEGRPVKDNAVLGLQQNDYPKLVDLMIDHLQLFHSKKNKIMILSLKTPQNVDDDVTTKGAKNKMTTPLRRNKENNVIVDIDDDLDSTDLFLKDESVMKTPPATPAFVPKIDMESVKKSKRRRRRIKLGMPARGGTPKKTNVDLKKKFDNVAKLKK